jgi:hypothetical protein
MADMICYKVYAFLMIILRVMKDVANQHLMRVFDLTAKGMKLIYHGKMRCLNFPVTLICVPSG